MSELCDILSKATGESFAPFVSGTYRELTEKVERGEVMIAWMPPVLALDLDDREIAHPLAVPIRSGVASYRTALIVRDRIPKSIKELKGVRMAWVDRESSSGYIVPRIHLASLGCDLTTFFSQETFQLSHTAVIDAVASGRADLGATFYCVDATGKLTTAGWTDADGTTIRSVKVAAHAGPIPNDMVIVSKKAPVSTRASIQRWFLGLDARSRELFGEVLHSSEFRVPSEVHLQPLRAMIAAARGV
jgi:phosphonate transport system substrate-binding protein